MNLKCMAAQKSDFQYICLRLRVEKLSEFTKRQLERSGIYSISDGESFIAYGIIDTLQPFSFISKTHPEVKSIDLNEPPNSK